MGLKKSPNRQKDYLLLIVPVNSLGFCRNCDPIDATGSPCMAAIEAERYLKLLNFETFMKLLPFGRLVALCTLGFALVLSGCVRPIPDPERRVLNAPPLFRLSTGEIKQQAPKTSAAAQINAASPGYGAPTLVPQPQPSRLFARRGPQRIDFNRDEILKQAALIAEINKTRRRFGKDELLDDDILTQTAAAYARQLAQRRHLDHKDSQGRGPDARVEERGYHWMYVAENLAAGQLTPAEVVQDWLNSPPHRAALLSDHPEELGVAYVRSQVSLREDPHLTYWVALFAKPQSAAAARR